jgi:hypothetical protein
VLVSSSSTFLRAAARSASYSSARSSRNLSLNLFFEPLGRPAGLPSVNRLYYQRTGLAPWPGARHTDLLGELGAFLNSLLAR